MRYITMNKLYNLINSNFNTIINYFDYFLLTIVIYTLLGDIIYLVSSIINHLIDFFNISGLDLINNMADNNNNNTTTTTIIHDDGSWANGIKTLFIYGTGGFRLSLLKAGGTPGTRAFIIVSTIAGYAVTRVLNNTINYPNYVKNKFTSWQSIWHSFSEGEASVTVDECTTDKLVNAINNNKFISGDNSLADLPQLLLNGIFYRLKFILEPVQVNYSNEILANQIYDISILLFILSLIIFGLLVVLLLNIILYINMDRIIKIFTNKYIYWYLVMNKKFLSIEIFILGGTILYFMHTLITGIRFIATHPILIN
uniref:hypothetical protein n=1 Tax=Daedaleopsis nitida TaxID=1140402 RepID=UPI0030E06FD3